MATIIGKKEPQQNPALLAKERGSLKDKKKFQDNDVSTLP